MRRHLRGCRGDAGRRSGSRAVLAMGGGKASRPFRSGAEPVATRQRYVLRYEPATAVSPGQQDALAGDEGLAQDEAGDVRKAALLPARM